MPRQSINFAKISRGLFNRATTKAGREQQAGNREDSPRMPRDITIEKLCRCQITWNGILNTFFFFPLFFSLFLSFYVCWQKKDIIVFIEYLIYFFLNEWKFTKREMENKLNIEIEKYRKRNIHERILKYTNFFYLQKKKKRREIFATLRRI